ncbi:MAG: tetrahydrofolate dehydrogenase/cyclohydrolase catalytic domain-containing protein [Pseudomonadota bacterium]
MNLAKIIDGKAIAANLRQNIIKDVLELKSSKNIIPGLAVILVGDNPASKLYVRNKITACKKVGIKLFEFYPEANVSEVELIKLINSLNENKEIHGILVQLPLPDHINSMNIINAIDPRKDVDGFTATNLGKLVTEQDCFVPCTPQGCLILIKSIIDKLDGLNALVVGRSNIVGKPMLHVLIQNNCTVTLAHSHTKNLPLLCKQADILVVAVGSSNLIKGDWIKPGSTVIDVGINYTADNKITGDVDFKEAAHYAGAISPVPGGAGPMTVTCLLKNTLKSALYSAL